MIKALMIALIFSCCVGCTGLEVSGLYDDIIHHKKDKTDIGCPTAVIKVTDNEGNLVE